MIQVEKAKFLMIFFWLTDLFNFKAAAFINVFDRKIYSRTGFLSAKLYLHETRHLQQLKEDGFFKFCILYLYYNIRYGYDKNPYEVDANNYTNNNINKTTARS